MGKVLEFTKSRMAHKIYENAFGVNLPPETVQFIRFTTALAFKTNAAHVAVMKEDDKFVVLSAPYVLNPVTRKVAYLNPFKYLYYKMFSSIVIMGIESNLKDVEEYLHATLGGIEVRFVRKLPQIPSYKLEEILNGQKNNSTTAV